MEINGVANPIHQLGRRQGGGGNDNKHPPPLFNCPRCESENTKFCYYNNYSLTQPRYYCKSCRRYWTQGGTLRNVPVGGGSRKSKRGPIRPPIPSGLSARPQPVAPVVRAPIPLNVVPPTTLAAPNFTGGSFMSSMTTMQPLPVNGGGGGNGGHFNGSLGSQMAVRQFNRPPTYFPQGSGSWNQGFGHSNISTETSVGTSMSWSNAGGFIGNDNAGSSFSQN